MYGLINGGVENDSGHGLQALRSVCSLSLLEHLLGLRADLILRVLERLEELDELWIGLACGVSAHLFTLT